MTIEQAINYLKSTGMSDEQIRTVVDAFTCEDCISREEVLKVIKNYASMLWKKYHEPFPESTVMEIIQALPHVTPQRKTGRWLSHREYCEKHDVIPSGLVTLQWCSNCDFGIDINELHGNHYNYCPNCGMKMEE